MPVKKSVPTTSKKEEKGDIELFGVAKNLKKKLKICVQKAGTEKQEDIVYLWICVSDTGLEQGFTGGRQKSKPLTMQQWLNVVDEAAALGANWLVLSLSDALGDCDAVWPISKWAQQVHGMMVGLHLKECETLSDREITLVRQLDSKKTRVLVRGEAAKAIANLKKKGITVWTANPQSDGETPNCQGPTRMIFVNEKGILYTCGLVEGNEAYRMGHVFDATLKNIITDPDTPRHVHDDIHLVTPGCDGCPALIANFFSQKA